jgi:Xaa-Pro aminopeptidase
VDATVEALKAAMRRAPTASHENQVQATVEFTFRDLGASGPGYPSIVASGANTTTLHYVTNDAKIPRDGLLLLDVGAEVGHYTADVTHTFPADGTFSEEQRAVYEAVLRTSLALMPHFRPGSSLRSVHERALALIGQELLALGLVTRADDAEQVKLYFMHGLGHPLGLAVHDVFDRARPFEAGMVATNEPGIYVRAADVRASAAWKALTDAERASVDAALAKYDGIGVRIEDDVLVTAQGPKVLSAGLPRTVEEIERFMAEFAEAAVER